MLASFKVRAPLLQCRLHWVSSVAMSQRFVSNESVVVITGVTTGMGNAMAKRFAAMGYKVAGCGRTAHKIEELRLELAGTAGSSPEQQHLFSVVDVMQNDQVQDWATEVLGQFGRVDVLINNAAMLAKRMPVWELPASDFEKVVDVNVKGCANTVRHFVPHMIAARQGIICNMSCWVGSNHMPGLTAAVTGKWALEVFSRNLALDLPAPLVSFHLDPGMVSTPMNEATSHPDELPKMITAEQWAKTMCPAIVAVNRSWSGQTMKAWEYGLHCAPYLDGAGELRLDDRPDGLNKTKDYSTETPWFLGDEQSTEAMFRYRAFFYDKQMAQTKYTGPSVTAAAIAGLGVDKTSSILDVAGGTGLLGEALSSHGFSNISLVDRSASMIEVAVSKGIYKQVSQGSFPSVCSDWPSSNVDVTVMLGALLTLGFIDPTSSLREMVRLTAPGGYVMLCWNATELAEPECADVREATGKVLDEVCKEGTCMIRSRKTFSNYLGHCEGTLVVLQKASP